jgi:hypothetical protein
MDLTTPLLIAAAAHTDPLYYVLIFLTLILPVCLAVWTLVEVSTEGKYSKIVQGVLWLIVAMAAFANWYWGYF